MGGINHKELGGLLFYPHYINLSVALAHIAYIPSCVVRVPTTAASDEGWHLRILKECQKCPMVGKVG